MNPLRIVPLLLAALVTGCAATAPAFENLPEVAAPSPYVVAEAPERFVDQSVVWGGMIVEVKNFEAYSEIEILAYPLDERQQPMLELADQGRFIAIAPGYVEGEDFAPGRFVSLIGQLSGGREDTLRNERYYWPEVALERLKVWPRDFRYNKRRFSVGVGVGIGI